MKAHFSENIHACVQLRGLKGENRLEFQIAPVGFLNKTRSCYIVHFDGAGKIFHVLCVDGRRILVRENDEKYSAELNLDFLLYDVVSSFETYKFVQWNWLCGGKSGYQRRRLTS